MAIAFALKPNVVSITAGTTAVQVAATSLGVNITAWILQNQGTGTIYVGGSAVAATAGSGLQLSAGSSINFGHERLRSDQQTYAPSNYWVITTATANTCVLFYNYAH